MNISLRVLDFSLLFFIVSMAITFFTNLYFVPLHLIFKINPYYKVDCNHLIFFTAFHFILGKLSLLVDFISWTNYSYYSQSQWMHPLSEA